MAESRKSNASRLTNFVRSYQRLIALWLRDGNMSSTRKIGMNRPPTPPRSIFSGFWAKSHTRPNCSRSW
ncbi:hypothetical protein H5410_014677 [Solanum commersonii]|uniref:Uncharacterized protein n=1 Tax=Solanum commersonii TaxID=4109 RepID=A0A9J5ZRJ1_SOLCO|nr:hypothetical protein H5410_014677 [Solanum commersonii]